MKQTTDPQVVGHEVSPRLLPVVPFTCRKGAEELEPCGAGRSGEGHGK